MLIHYFFFEIIHFLFEVGYNSPFLLWLFFYEILAILIGKRRRGTFSGFERGLLVIGTL